MAGCTCRFNPIIVRFKLIKLCISTVGLPRFNPIIVRFKHGKGNAKDCQVFSFNPIIVRFKPLGILPLFPSCTGFNPIIVRFKHGKWTVYAPFNREFQSYNSSIQTWFGGLGPAEETAGFNPIIVRFKPCLHRGSSGITVRFNPIIVRFKRYRFCVRNTSKLFQSYNSSIQTSAICWLTYWR